MADAPGARPTAVGPRDAAAVGQLGRSADLAARGLTRLATAAQQAVAADRRARMLRERHPAARFVASRVVAPPALSGRAATIAGQSPPRPPGAAAAVFAAARAGRAATTTPTPPPAPPPVPPVRTPPPPRGPAGPSLPTPPGPNGPGGLPSYLNATSNAATGAQLGILKLVGATYLLRSAASALRAGLVEPFAELAWAVSDATERSRKLEIALSSTAGGMARARTINRALAREVRDLPLSLAEARDAARTLASSPSLAGRLAAGSDASAVAESVRLAKMTSRLAAIDPAQGTQGALVAIRELAEGGGADSYRSLRRRFGWSAQRVAAAAGASMDEALSDPSVALRGVERLADLFVSDAAMQRSNQLVSVRLQKIRDAFEAGLAEVGESGVFDSTVSRLEQFTDELYRHLDGGRFQQQAARMSSALDATIGNVSRGVTRFVRAAGGLGAGDDTIAGAVEGFTAILGRVADASAGLPGIAERLGVGVERIAGMVGRLVDVLGQVAQAADDPGRAARGFGTAVADRLNAEEAERRRLERLATTLDRVGVPAAAEKSA